MGKYMRSSNPLRDTLVEMGIKVRPGRSIVTAKNEAWRSKVDGNTYWRTPDGQAMTRGRDGIARKISDDLLEKAKVGNSSGKDDKPKKPGIDKKSQPVTAESILKGIDRAGAIVNRNLQDRISFRDDAPGQINVYTDDMSKDWFNGAVEASVYIKPDKQGGLSLVCEFEDLVYDDDKVAWSYPIGKNMNVMRAINIAFEDYAVRQSEEHPE